MKRTCTPGNVKHLRHSGNLLAGIQKNKMSQQPAVYILANNKNDTLYVGVASDLVKRVWEHRNNFVERSSPNGIWSL